MATLRPTTRRRRVLLVLSLVLIPGAVLSVVTWRLMGQERELEAGRLVERRALIVAQLAQQMLLSLEQARQRVMTSAVDAVAASDSGIFIIIAPLTADGMVLPWEQGGPPVGAADEVAARIREGEALEFGQGRPDLASESYAAAVRAAESPASRIQARLHEARALTRAGQTSAALAAYAEAAAASPELQDVDGMPLALYGAEGLLLAERPDSRAAALGVLEAVVAEPALAPTALYALRDLVRRVAVPETAPGSERADSDDLLERVLTLEVSAATRISAAERAVELRRDLPALLALAGSTALGSAWLPYGPEPWLVGVSDNADGRLVFVADPARLLSALDADDLAEILPHVRITTAPQPEAELLGPSFPAVFAVLPDAALPGTGRSDLGWVLPFIVMPLVLAITLVAAFLLWRDVRREIETAGLRAQFVSSVSHELKTPLTSIRMLAETLLLGRQPVEADRVEYLETIVNESERLSRLINNVLDFSSIERDGRTYHMEPTALDAVVRDAARAMSYPLAQGGFDLRVHTAEVLPVVDADGDALTQAVLNLLSNAVKFSGEERLIELQLARENGDALIRVRDHGRGIERRHQSAVFERFFRAPDVQAEGVPGTGLGLALVDHVARAHGGRVELDSAPGQGSTFTIRLPLTGRPAGPDGSAPPQADGAA